MTIDVSLKHIPDHADRASALLPGYMQDQPNIAALMKPILEEFQRLEDTTYSLIVDRTLNTAAGASLDQYGELLDEPRAGWGDGLYRRLLKAKIVVNNSAGTIDDYTKIAQIMTEATSVRVIVLQEMSTIVEYLVPDEQSATWRVEIIRMLEAAAALGVRLLIFECRTAAAFAFEEDIDGLPGFDVGEQSEFIN